MSKDTADDGRMMLRAKQLLALLGVTLVAACGSSPTTEGPSSIPAQTENAGDVVGQESLPDVDPLVTDAASSSRLITYSSHYAVDDSLHHVTTSVYVPKEPPPPDGFPIAALDRQVGGTGRGCGPASDADWSATITALLRSGYVVTVPDYQGFGRPSDHEANFHPFLDSATAAQNTIDAVRTTRTVVPQTSAWWVAVGTAQGGQAVWAANELADNYGWGLNLKGTVSISPTADISGLVDAAVAGTLTTQQDLAYVAYLDALAKQYPEDFYLDDYRHGVVAQNWDLLLGCANDTAAQRASIVAQITADDLRPASPDAVTTLRGYLSKTDLPQGPAVAPMLVVYGGQDPLTPAAWTDRALARACSMSDVIAVQRLPDASPPNVEPAITVGWIADRLHDAPAANDCAQLNAADPPPAPAAAPVKTTAADHSPSLIGGCLPIAIQVVALAAVLVTVGWRTRRWRLRLLPIAGLVGLVVVAAADGYVVAQGWGDDSPPTMWIWIAVTGAMVAVLVLGWRSASWWRRVVSILAVPLAAISAASVLNASLGYLPTVQTAWERVTGAKPLDWIDEPTLAAMVRDGVRPRTGTIVSVRIPADHSGFAHRDELVYLPPAWFASDPPPRLPAVMMIGAELSHPSDWPESGDALRILNEFARKHHGVTPISVFPDSTGTFTNDTECVNGPRGNAADHLTKDVIPYVTSHFGVSLDPSQWAVLGWSSGGTCALTLAVMHPELFSAIVDLDGQLGPNAGNKQQTIARLFGGDTGAWAASDPKTVVDSHGQYPGMSAWVAVSEPTTTTYRPAGTYLPAGAALGDRFGDWDTSSEDHADTATQLCELLSAHGIECAVSSYAGAHDFPSAATGLAAALPWLAGKIGTPGLLPSAMPGQQAAPPR